jgi:peptide deformylase
MEEIKFIQTYTPYLLGAVGVLILISITIKLILFTKKNLFEGMMSIETYKEQMERERLVLLHYTNITGQLDDVIRQARKGEFDAEMIAHKLEDLATALDENIVNQILRLSTEERAVIKEMRNREPTAAMLRRHDEIEKN